jgi:hypothetical protein
MVIGQVRNPLISIGTILIQTLTIAAFLPILIYIGLMSISAGRR